MRNDKLITILEDFGLSDNEARVYLSALFLGPTTILKLARATGIKRTTVYSVVESLKQVGLMSVDIKGFKTFFVAESPKKIESIINNRKEELNKYLPNFLALYNLKGSESLIKYYEGLEAVKSVYEGLLEDVKAHDDYLVMGAQEQWYKLDPNYFKNFIKKRAKIPINIRLLLIDSAITREHKRLEKIYNEKIKILPKETQLTTNLVVIPKKVVIHQLVPPIMAIVIENPSIVQMHRELFEIIWRSI